MSEAPMTKLPGSDATPNTAGEESIDLIALLYRLMEKWKIIAATAILGAVIAAVYSIYFVTPLYTATSKLYVVNNKDSAINLSDIQISSYLAKDYQEVFKNWHVHELVLQKLNLNYSYSGVAGRISVSNPSNTRILYITATSPDPGEAQALANTYAEVAREFIAVKMDTQEPTLFQEALKPSRPSSPNRTKNVMVGFLLGFFLATGIIVILSLMDDYVRTTDDVEKYIGVPVLGTIMLQPGDDEESKKSRGKHTSGRRKQE